MLPPLHAYPTAAHYYSQQPSGQPWPAASSAGAKGGGNPVYGNAAFGSSSTGSGTGAPSSRSPELPAAATSLPPATSSGRPTGITQGQAGSPSRLGGSAGSSGSGRAGDHGRGAAGAATSQSLSGPGGGPLPPPGAQSSQPQPPKLSRAPGSGSSSQRQSPEQGDRDSPDQPPAEDLEADPDQEEQGAPVDDPEQLQELQLQLQQQQLQQQASSNPYLQLLSQAGVGIGGITPYAGSLAAAAQAAHEVQQAALRKRVQRDIRRMLAGNRAYQQHVNGPPAISAESLAALAQPKLRPGSLPDSQAVANLPDPVDWARWKTDQLVISRLQGERRQAELADEKRRAEEHLVAFRQHKIEAKRAEADAKVRAAAEEAAYRANMSAYLNHKGKLELDDYRKRKEEQSERLALMRSRQVKSLSAHHY